MKRIAVAGLLVLGCLASQAHAQSASVSAGRWYFGGGVGLGFGDITYVEISPLVGYRVTDRVSVGGSLLYRYRNDDRFSPSIDTSDYGGGLFTRYSIVGPFFLQAEYEYLNYEVLQSNRSTTRMNANSLFAGGGISQPINRNTSVFATVLYNLTYSSYDEPGPYSSPWVVRVGVAFGF